MIVTLKVKLGDVWSADIEISELATLEDLHFAIQDAVDFDNDHLYAFYVGRASHARNRITYDDEIGTVFDTTIRDIYPLPPKQSLFYLFDFGDSWMFKVSRTRKKPHEPVDGVEYPRVVNETGEKPIQYQTDDDWE